MTSTPIDVESIYEKLKHIPGDNTFSLSNMRWFVNNIDFTEVNSIVEIGTMWGRSAAFWALVTGGNVWSVDIVDRREKVYNHLHKNYQEEFDKIRFVVDPIITQTWDKTVDMVFIDGNHKYDSVLNDIKFWTPHAKKIVCGHDYSPHFQGVVRAVDDFWGNLALTGCNCWVIKKG